jgi:magnesium transporter
VSEIPPESVTVAPETAAQYLVADVPVTDGEQTVAAALARIAEAAPAFADTVYVTGPDARLRGVLNFPQLLAADPQSRVCELVVTHVPAVAPEEDQEQVAAIAIEYHLPAVPVVDGDQRLLGVVPTDALLGIQQREHVEDMHRLVGILKDHEQARDAIEGAAVARVLGRLPWLLIGLLGSMFATWMMASFEDTLRERLAVAFFIPAIVYLADAIGTQTEAVAVRGLTLSRMSLTNLLFGELRTGLVIGVIMGVVIVPTVYAAFGDLRLGLAVALAVVVAGGCASGIGLLLPWLLSRLGQDPAFGSGPVATILQDILSLASYFLVVVLLLR